MLRAPRSDNHRFMQLPSLRRRYEEFIEQRIEEYKDQLSREKLLHLADEAVRELELGTEDQLVLTEVLILDHVDRLIKKRLRLPTFRRWRERHLKTRLAQREPTHWGLAPESPLADIAPCAEDGDLAIIVGARSARAGFYLAAHDWDVLLLDQELNIVEAEESRAVSESLAHRFQGLVVSLDGWFPDVLPSLVVLDPMTLGRLAAPTRRRLIETVMEQTVPGGVHLLDPSSSRTGGNPIRPDALQSQYVGWIVPRDLGGSDWFVARKP